MKQRITKATLNAKLRNIDFSTTSPAEMALGLIEIDVHFVANTDFLEKLLELIDQHTQ